MFGLFIIWFPFIVLIFGSVLPRRQLQHLFCGAVQDAVVIGLDHFNLPPVGSDENVIVYRAHVKCEGALAVLIKSVGSRSARREVEYETIYAHGGEGNGKRTVSVKIYAFKDSDRLSGAIDDVEPV